ncbi:hypothetical protein PV409_33295 [Streptomyces sp. ME02-6979.5a]|uniref:hypothetical protein n=1 Tax=Streptomyces sp. ME02-6979.5a TaxID=462925 RepID=UPI0029BE99F5|nr:hypothetical protein [Streptomyces sp. ME02-6979.5a]MDX3342836.1 hypothetical protein [Streptomyces sp. ME02-6979.5a]
MANEIEKTAERVAKLRAQADKLSGPLADAQAQLQSAQEAEAARRAARAATYDRKVASSWMARAETAGKSGDDAHAHFAELLSEEPWFAAYVEYRAARYRRGHVVTEAQRAQTALGDPVTAPEQRWHGAEILEEIVKEVEKQAAARGAEFGRELDETREAFVSGTD